MATTSKVDIKESCAEEADTKSVGKLSMTGARKYLVWNQSDLIVTIVVVIIAVAGFIGSMAVAACTAEKIWKGDKVRGGPILDMLMSSGNHCAVPESELKNYDDDTEDKVRMRIELLVFSLAYMISTVFLFFGAITKKSHFAYPWLICEFATLVSQFALLFISCPICPFITQSDDLWISLGVLFVTVYCMMIVLSAQADWRDDDPPVKPITEKKKKNCYIVTGCSLIQKKV